MVAVEKSEVVRARMTPEEVLMLKALAGKDETMSDVIRDLVRNAYQKQFGAEKPRRSQSPTLRGIIEDITGPAHFTAGGVAKRTGLNVRRVLAALEGLAEHRLVERVDRTGSDSTWESLITGGAKRLLRAADAAGFDVDADLRSPEE
jgi:hypothetical protein